MKVNVDVSDDYEETVITIKAKQWSEELDAVMKAIKGKKVARILAVEEEQTVLLNPKDIDYIFSENRKVYAIIDKKKMELRMKLYEIEESLESLQFMRFSKSVIGNINNIQRFELSFNGNLCVHFQSNNKEYITRKYVKQVKEELMRGGRSNDY